MPDRSSADDGAPDVNPFERVLQRGTPSRLIGWRLGAMLGLTLLGCLALLALVRALTQAPGIAGQWTFDNGRPVLVSSTDPRLDALRHRALLRIESGDLSLEPSAALLQTGPRWVVDSAARSDLLAQRRTLAAILAGPQPVVLRFDGGASLAIEARPRGWRGLGLPFWLLAAPALLLYLASSGLLLAHPRPRSALYAVLCGSQSLGLLWLGLDAGQSLASWPAWLIDDLPWRLGLDLAAAAAALHLFTIYPVKMPRWRLAALGGWIFAAALTGLAMFDAGRPGLWWWGQAGVMLLSLAAFATLSFSRRVEPHPLVPAMQRLGAATLLTLLGMQAAVIASQAPPGPAYDVSVLAVGVWSLFFATLLMWVPFLSRGRQLLRELALLAGLCTVAVSLDLLLGSLLALDPLATMTLAALAALAAYAGGRRWLLDQVSGQGAVTTERTFEHLYRIARDLQKHPERQVTLVGELMRELFAPLELHQVAAASSGARVTADGAAMIVPVVVPGGDGEGRAAVSLVLRYARGGQRLFTRDDARLSDRVVEQLRQAVAYDRAVERGRSEERLRIAQDLHDDIGARLLTLMYKAQDPEVEDYLRYTLQDLKTLTRGLATGDHRLSHAVAEWKSDLQQRLTAADVQMGWTFDIDHDLELNVVQWSALTRVLRELVSNAIAHAHAGRVDITGVLSGGNLRLTIEDDGVGREPAAWSHGLGLGGIRKRVKQLGGSVTWREASPRGIVCEVRVPGLGTRG